MAAPPIVSKNRKSLLKLVKELEERPGLERLRTISNRVAREPWLAIPLNNVLLSAAMETDNTLIKVCAPNLWLPELALHAGKVLRSAQENPYFGGRSPSISNLGRKLHHGAVTYGLERIIGARKFEPSDWNHWGFDPLKVVDPEELVAAIWAEDHATYGARGTLPGPVNLSAIEHRRGVLSGTELSHTATAGAYVWLSYHNTGDEALELDVLTDAYAADPPGWAASVRLDLARLPDEVVDIVSHQGCPESGRRVADCRAADLAFGWDLTRAFREGVGGLDPPSSAVPWRLHHLQNATSPSSGFASGYGMARAAGHETCVPVPHVPEAKRVISIGDLMYVSNIVEQAVFPQLVDQLMVQAREYEHAAMAHWLSQIAALAGFREDPGAGYELYVTHLQKVSWPEPYRTWTSQRKAIFLEEAIDVVVGRNVLGLSPVQLERIATMAASLKSLHEEVWR